MPNGQTSKTTSTGTSTSTSDAERTRIVSLTKLADTVDELKRSVTGGGSGGNDSRETKGGAPSGSVDEQVSRAVAAAREQDAAKTAEEKRKQEVDERIKALEQRTEKRPAEKVSWLRRFMWGSGDE